MVHPKSEADNGKPDMLPQDPEHIGFMMQGSLRASQNNRKLEESMRSFGCFLIENIFQKLIIAFSLIL